MDGDPSQAAQAWYALVSDTIASLPGIDFWEGYNEPPSSPVATMQWYAAFEVERVQLLAAVGRKAAIGQFSTGTPDVTNPAIIQAFYPAIDAAIAAGGVLALHEVSRLTHRIRVGGAFECTGTDQYDPLDPLSSTTLRICQIATRARHLTAPVG